VGLGVIAHVFATPVVLVHADLATRAAVDWWGVLCWTVAGALMFPLALMHHFVCRYCGWYWGLAQPGTFFLVVVLNALLWVEAWRWFWRWRAAVPLTSVPEMPPERQSTQKERQ
jgi:hypothetical protein